MKQLQTEGNDIIVIEVPKDAYNYRFYINGALLYDTISKKDNTLFNIMEHFNHIKCKILGKLSELTEEECSKFVHKMIGNNPPEQEIKFRGKYYNYLDYTIYCLTAKDSFISLLQSNEIDTNNNLLLIEVL